MFACVLVFSQCTYNAISYTYLLHTNRLTLALVIVEALLVGVSMFEINLRYIHAILN